MTMVKNKLNTFTTGGTRVTSYIMLCTTGGPHMHLQSISKIVSLNL